MKRIAILTAGGDTPALNATIHGAVTRANEVGVEVIGLSQGFASLYDPRVPHIRLNPLLGVIPELDPTRGGTILGASRKYVEAEDTAGVKSICDRLTRLKVDALICVGGDGTFNGLQPLCDHLPTVLAPKTIDNDLGLNYPQEPDAWKRREAPQTPLGYRYEMSHTDAATCFRLEDMVNYVTPGYATAVWVSARGIGRMRTTAESHRRVAIVEVMGRHSGFIALGSAYGQPDLILIPESPVNVNHVAERVREIYDRQRNVLIVCGEGIVDENGLELGAERRSTDPAGNLVLSGAAERLRELLIDAIGDKFFRARDQQSSAARTIFTRKVGHTQRGGRPVLFDRFCAAQLGAKAIDMLLEGQNNTVATFMWSAEKGFYVDSCHGNRFRDRWGVIHARQLHPSFYDPQRLHVAATGIEYLLPIFNNAIGADDTESIRQTVFDAGNLYHPYHSVNVDISRRMQYLR